MSETVVGLRRKIGSAGDLQTVVRTMKAMAASSISQYEQAVRALGDYYLNVERGLGLCFRELGVVESMAVRARKSVAARTNVVVFGSDQGLVGQFNDVVAERAIQAFLTMPAGLKVWAVGERVHARLADSGHMPVGGFGVPNSVKGISALVGQILTATGAGDDTELHLFYNRPSAGEVYAPVTQRLLPLDESFCRRLAKRPWPTGNLPEVVGGEGDDRTLRTFVREYLFVSLFRACAESLASENASRLAAMQRAEKNIEELLADLNATFHRVRQSGIDAELFDVIAGFEALSGADSS